jgi:hypothetical protein
MYVSGTMHRSTVLGIIGGVVGIIVGIAGTVFSVYQYNMDQFVLSNLLGSIAVIVFSAVGMTMSFMEDRKRLAGALMIVSGVAVFAGMFIFGLVTVIMFILGGAFYLAENRVSGVNTANRAP